MRLVAYTLFAALLATLCSQSVAIPAGAVPHRADGDSSHPGHSGPDGGATHKDYTPHSGYNPDDPFDGVNFADTGKCRQYLGMRGPRDGNVKIMVNQATRNDPNRRIYEGEYIDSTGASVALRVTMQKGGSIEILSVMTRGTLKFRELELHASGDGKVLPAWQGWYINTQHDTRCTQETGLTFSDINGYDIGYD